MSERFISCVHCHADLGGFYSNHGRFCSDCDYWAGRLGELVLCQTCPDEQIGLRCNDADTLADFAAWCRRAGKGVDGLATYPEAKVLAGVCIEDALAKLAVVA
jgi:hypothetical protein